MHVLIIGGTGLIGRALTEHLLQEGFKVTVLSRKKGALQDKGNFSVKLWDGKTGESFYRYLSGVDAVLNLSGANIGAGRWTQKRKKLIVESRLNTGKALVEAFKLSPEIPRVLIQASAVGYYGSRGDEILTEESYPGRGFLSELAQEWEESTEEIESLGVRRAVIRTGLVLSADSSAFQKMIFPVRLGFAGPVGSGRQWVSWIHIEDEVRAIRFLVSEETAAGPYNLCAPEPVTNSEFMKTAARTLRKPYWFSVPSILLKAVFGEMSSVLLDSQRAVPKRLLEAGFRFKYERLADALDNLLLS